MAKLKLKNSSQQREPLQSSADVASAPSLSTPVANKLMPPPARPPKGSVQLQTPNSAQSDTGASARKRRRRRARKSAQGDFSSESASVVSNNTTLNTEAGVVQDDLAESLHEPNTNGWSHVNGDNSDLKPLPTPSSQVSLRDTLTEEQRRIYDKEPEMFGEYAFSSVDEDDPDYQSGSVKNTSKEVRATGPGLSKVVRDSKTSQALVGLDREGSRTEKRPKSVAKVGVGRQTHSDPTSRDQNHAQEARALVQKAGTEVPTEVPVLKPIRLSNGRFACPYIESHDCQKTLAYEHDMRGHIRTHDEPDKFRCTICGKNTSRKDKLKKHMAQHSKETNDENHSGADAGDGISTKHHEPPQTQYEPMELDVEVTDAEPEPPSDDELTNQARDTPRSAPDEPVSNSSTSQELIAATTTENANQEQRKLSIVLSPPSRKRKRPSRDATDNDTSASKTQKRPRRDDTVSNVILDSSAAAQTSVHVHPEPTSHHNLMTSKKVSKKVSRGKNSSESVNIEEEHALTRAHPPPSENDTKNTSKGVPSRSHAHKEYPQHHTETSNGENSRLSQYSGASIPVRSKSNPPLEKRQSSLDSFVERSGSDVAQSKANLGGKRIIVNIPPPPKANGAKQQKASTSHRALSAKRIPTRKGKEKAASSEDADSDQELGDPAYDDEEQTSSDDRPKATTMARRTSSLNSKKPTLSKKRKKSDSDEDDSNGSELEAARSRRKARPANREASFKELAKMGEIGRFTDREVEILDGWRDRFCMEHDISQTEFNDMMTQTLRKKIKWKLDISKNDFLQEFYNQLPNRNRRAMLRFRERHFQNLENDEWTEKDDKELKDLIQQLGPKWVEIGQMMGRSQDFVFQRWTHRLNRGQEKNTGPWTEAEEKALFREVQAIAKAQGKSPSSKKLKLSWAAISVKLGTQRTAQQCSNKWRNETTKREGATYVEVPLNDRIPSSGAKAPRTPSKMAKRLAGSSRTPTSRASSSKTYKSAERVDNSDEADDEHDGLEQGDVPAEEEEDNLEHVTELASEDDNASASVKENDVSDLNAEDHFTKASVQSDGAAEMAEGQHSKTTTQLDGAAETARVRKYVPSPSPPPRVRASQKTTLQKGRTEPITKSSPRALARKLHDSPTVSKNPFPATTAPNLLQAFAATQARSTSSQSVSSNDPLHSIPDRPSPGNSIRKKPLSPTKHAISPPGSKATGPSYTEIDDAKSPNSFVSAREVDATSTEEDADATRNEVDSNEAQSQSDSGSDTESESESGSESERNTEGEAEASSEDEDRPGWPDESKPVTAPSKGGGFLSSIRRFVPFTQSKASQIKDVSVNQKNKQPFASMGIGNRGTAQSDDDDENDE